MSGIVQGRGWNRLFVAAVNASFLIFGVAASCRAAGTSWTANLAVGTNLDGRLEVFEVNKKGELRHRWQRESLHDWSAWSSLGGGFFPGVAVVNDEAGRLGVFAVDRVTKHVTYNFQKSPNSPAWSNWTSLPGQSVTGALAAGQDLDGRLEVFAVGANDGSVEHIWQDGKDWSEWMDMGGAFEPGLVVARNRSGQLEVFGINLQNHVLMHGWQTTTNVPGEWSEWFSLKEPVLPGFAVAQNVDGRLEVFGVNAFDGKVGHTFQLSATPEAKWSPWSNLGVKMRPVITWGRNPDGRVEIFTVSSTNGMIFHSFQMRAGATTNWAGWTDMSLVGGLNLEQRAGAVTNGARWTHIGGATQSYPAIGKNSEGTLEIFASDERLDDVLNHRRQVAGILSWTDWLSLDAATSQYLSRGWRMDDGLPDNRVQAIAQTPDGYIWVGTHNGLARFDGIQFVSCDVKTKFGMTNPSITCLCAPHNGALWVGSASDGLACISGGQIFHYGKSNGLAGDCLTVLLEGRDGSVWIGTTTGLSHYQAGKLANYTRKDGLSSDTIRSALQDSTGALWITTDHGLTCVRDKSISVFTQSNGLPDNSVTGIWQDVPGRMWIGSDHGLILYRAGRFYAYDTKYGLSDRLTSVIRSDSQGNLWVGNNNGLNQFKDGRFYEGLDQEGNSFGKISALFEDREENLWAGSQDGLFRLTPKRLLLHGKPQQLTHNNITTVMEDDSGSLWIGTWGGGLDQLKDETVTAYGPATGFKFDLISSLCKGRDGSLWVGGGYGSGLIQMNHGAAGYREWRDGLADATIKVIHEDRSGNLWLGTSKGLLCLKAGRFATNTATRRLADSAVRAICEGPEGALWFGTEDGLSRWKDGQLAHFTVQDGLSDNRVTALYLDEEQTLWIGTQNGGLNRSHGDRFTSYTVSDGLFSNEIFEILEDDFGWLWMSCSKGVFRVSKRSFDDFDHKRIAVITSIAYGHDDGMESVLCGNGKPGSWKTRDGELWFPTGKGLVAFDPRILKVNRIPPPVYIEDLIADQRPLPNPNILNESGGLAPPSFPVDVRVPPGRGELEFHYTAPSFQRPERILFKYKLEGIDPDWISAGTRRVAYYNNLSPGRYRFHVIARNSDGVWNDAGAAMSIILLPHLWQTWWFRFLGISAVMGLVAGTARQVTRRKMQRKLELLEQKNAIEKERLRIAQDIHDDLGGSLTQIALLGELAIGTLANPGQAAKHLTKITDSARLNVRALDEIVWAVHPGNDTLNSLVLYLWQFAEEFFGASGVRCRVDAPPNIPSYPLSSDLRHNIFLAVKEVFNNTLKHARASEVRMHITMTHSDFIIAIADNGKGFPLATLNGSGNGLANMKRRIEEMGGKMTLSSVVGRGTRVEFILPLKNDYNVN